MQKLFQIQVVQLQKLICQQELSIPERNQLELCTFNIHMHLELLKIVFDEVKVQKDLDLIQELLNPIQEE
jgi:hypothetical protein